jgi:hypothetical protein
MMKNRRFLRWGTPPFLLLIGLFLISIIFPLGAETTVPAQEEGKIVEEKDLFKAPAKVERVRSRIGPIELGKKIETADEDWMRGLTVTVRNLSDKTVTHLLIDLQFVRPKGQEGERDLIDSIEYGPIPGLTPAQQPQVVTEQPPIPPGESVDIRLNERNYETLLQILRELKYQAGIKRVKLSILELDYSDGTKWSGGRVFKRDPRNPEKWIPLNRNL